jgi:hypothetical protein
LRRQVILFIARIVEKIWFIYDVLFNGEINKKSLNDPKPIDKYITGNFFKRISNFIINDETIPILLNTNLSKSMNNSNTEKVIYFIEMAKTKPENIEKVSKVMLPGSKAIFHNGDKLDIFDLNQLKRKSIKIFAVNSINESDVSALPIGLENLELENNGKIEDFLNINDLIPANDSERSIYICVNFRLRTNYAERINILSSISELPLAKFFWFKSPKAIHKIYRKSLFVISPPGNGFDCHRTWEAIYSGAIPILLKDKIDTDLVESLPILVVKDYTEIYKYSEIQLKNLYYKIWSQSNLDKIKPFYWKEFING